MKVFVLAVVACLAAAPVFAAGDPVAGGKVYQRCLPCHAIGDDAPNKIGPELNNIVGAPAGAVPDFYYSEAMKAAGANGLVWTPGELAKFLSQRSGDYLPAVKMTFAGLKKPDDVANLIAYLETYSPAASQQVAAPPLPPPPPSQ